MVCARLEFGNGLSKTGVKGGLASWPARGVSTRQISVLRCGPCWEKKIENLSRRAWINSID